MIELRSTYQTPIFEECLNLVRQGTKRVLVQMPTGAGKTDWASYLLARAVQKGKKAHFWVHRRELIRQSVLALERAGVQTGIVAAGYAGDANAPVQVCSIGSMKCRMDRLAVPDLIIADEIHHAPALTWSSLLNHYSKLGSVIIGLSATPWRLSGEGLSPWFDHMIVGPSTAELIEEGWLSKYRLFAPNGHVDLTGVRTTAGDYNKADVEVRMKASSVMGDALKHYLKHANGKRALIFAWSIDSSIEMAEKFNAAGISAAHIDGSTPDRERDLAIDQFSKGHIKVLTNVNIATEGLNIPGIEALFMLRPTQSLVFYLQTIGRALRPAEGKAEALIFDHCGNCVRHGLPDSPREWTLDGDRQTKKEKRKKPANVRICPKCDEVSSIAIRVCPCGYTLVQGREMDVDDDAELSEMNSLPAAVLKSKEDRKKYFVLLNVAKKNGIRHPDLWARMKMDNEREKREARELQIPLPIPSKEVEEKWMF